MPPASREMMIVASNYPQLSISLESLFSGGARVAELRGEGDPALLLPAEAVFLGQSVPKRAREFAAGRVCARRALAEFGIQNFPIERGADRQPLWPPPVTGSITHTAGFCAAAVASRDTTLAIGLDTEVVGVEAHLWPSICLPVEIEWLQSLPESRRIQAATLIFSAKEAFYKCQFPMTLQYLGFHDVRVDVRSWNRERGDFCVAATKNIAFAAHASLPIGGHHIFHEEFVTAGVRVAA